MTKILTGATMLAIVLISGCASTGGQKPSATPVEPAATTAAAPRPLLVAPGSAKRLVLNMSGPAAVTQAKDWPAFQEEWRATFAEHAKDASVTFDMQRGEARATGEAGTLLSVYVNDYHMVGIGSRIFFGVMTGNAYIDAKASFADLNGGTAFGERTYNTTSSVWAGVFGKMTPQQVDAIATQMFGELVAR